VELEIFGLKTLNNGSQCLNELPILSLPLHDRVQPLPPYLEERGKVSAAQHTICEAIFSLMLSHSHGYYKKLCRLILAEAVLGLQ